MKVVKCGVVCVYTYGGAVYEACVSASYDSVHSSSAYVAVFRGAVSLLVLSRGSLGVGLLVKCLLVMI